MSNNTPKELVSVEEHSIETPNDCGELAMETLALMSQYYICVRRIPLKVVSKWRISNDRQWEAPLKENCERIEEDGQRYLLETKYPKNGGMWMAKQETGSGSMMSWSTRHDNLSDTVHEAVAKAVAASTL
ncbi:hypothetical protein [Vibrio sp. D431a]|uniref:hypothetical protein n=1 Tax=Vibrio sp. D431a TaxID=2837388 RepID=UPI002557B783|nr:hypothetical protein [Vibrio sp. D431a]MDK9793749.1 hypothetical protein [Vibrio sp. D431a]